MSSAICLNLGQSKILSSNNGTKKNKPHTLTSRDNPGKVHRSKRRTNAEYMYSMLNVRCDDDDLTVSQSSPGFYVDTSRRYIELCFHKARLYCICPMISILHSLCISDGWVTFCYTRLIDWLIDWLNDWLVFNAIFNIISVILQRSVNQCMLSWSSIYPFALYFTWPPWWSSVKSVRLVRWKLLVRSPSATDQIL